MYRSNTVLAVLAICITFFSPLSSRANLLRDAGFESGTAWVLADDLRNEGWAAWHGTNGLAMYGWTDGGLAYQDVAATGASNYTFTVFGSKDDTFSLAALATELRLEFYTDDTATQQVAAYTNRIAYATGAWTMYGLSAPAPTNAGMIRVALSFGGSVSGGGFKWDDADLVADANSAAAHYVSMNGANVFPYTNWVTAAREIQAGISAALCGDTVLVSNGTYALISQVTVTKGLTVQGVGGAANTIVDGSHMSRCFYLGHPDAVLDGFTVTNGYEFISTNLNTGGGILSDRGGMIRNCRITGCTVMDPAWGDWVGATAGAGIYMTGPGRVVDCEVFGNTAYGGFANGGGLYAEDSEIANVFVHDNRAASGTYFNYYGKDAAGGGLYAVRCAVRGCTFSNNIAVGPSPMYGGFAGGGGAFCNGGSVTNCVFVGNLAKGGSGSQSWAPGFGGGLYLVNGAAARNCLVQDNRAVCSTGWGPASGGGVYMESTSSLFNSRVIGNIATGSGGDVQGGGVFSGTGCMIANCVVAGNGALGDNTDYEYRRGGGIYASGSYIINCTIVSNQCTSTYGGGVFLTDHGYIDNSIVYYNIAATYTTNTWHNVMLYSGTASHCCATPAPSGVDNITNAPAFVDAASGNYHVALSSPCVDAGELGAIPIAYDADGLPRPLDGNNDGVAAFDIGAYEFVHPLADTDHDGLADTNELAGTSSAIMFDTDNDGMGDFAEIKAGTAPNDPSSFLDVQGAEPADGLSGGFIVRWSSVGGKQYTLCRATNLLNGFTESFQNITATPPMNAFTDTTATAASPYYYKIRVE